MYVCAGERGTIDIKYLRYLRRFLLLFSQQGNRGGGTGVRENVRENRYSRIKKKRSSES